MAASAAFAGIAVATVLFGCALGATITVGGPGGGWDQTTDLQTWAASQAFNPGDTMLFTYSPNHDVLEVTKSAYDACQTNSPVATHTGGTTSVKLPAPGKRYFICGTAGHCTGGMKLEVDVTAAAATAPAPASPTPEAAPTPGSPKASPEPPSAVPSEPPSAVPSVGSSPRSSPASPSPAGSAPQPPPSTAAGLRASSAAAASTALLVLLAIS